MNDIVSKAEEMCKRCRVTQASDDQYMVVRLADLETLVDLAKKGSIFTDMVNTWIRLTKEEKERVEKVEDDIGEQV